MADDDAAWWAKLRRAAVHVNTVEALVSDFRASNPYTLTPEATAEDEVGFRLRIHREAPADIATAAGDVLHNIRSALDALAFALADRSVLRPLTPAESEASEFPIAKAPADFDAFFGKAPKPNRRQATRAVFSDRAQQALRAGQSFYWAEQGPELPDIDRDTRYEDQFRWSTLRRVRALHNIDKHRRLNLFVFWPDLFYFGTNDDDDVRFRWGRFLDGAILCYLSGADAVTTHLHYEFALVLEDGPTYSIGTDYTPTDCVDLLRGFHTSALTTVSTVLSRYASLP